MRRIFRLCGEAGGVTWTPASLTNVQLWLREEYTESGGELTQWTDKSVNARHATPPGASNRPAITATDSDFSNNPSFTFANPDQLNYGTDNIAGTNSPLGIYMVLEGNAIAGHDCLLSVRTETLNRNVVLFQTSGPGYSPITIGFTGSGLTGLVPASYAEFPDPHSLVVGYDGGGTVPANASEWSMWVNNAAKSLSASGGSLGTNNHRNVIGDYSDTAVPTFPFDGKMVEIVIDGAEPTTESLAGWASYVAARYGIAQAASFGESIELNSPSQPPNASNLWWKLALGAAAAAGAGAAAYYLNLL